MFPIKSVRFDATKKLDGNLDHFILIKPYKWTEVALLVSTEDLLGLQCVYCGLLVSYFMY